LNVPLDFSSTVSHLIVYLIPDCNTQRNLYFEYAPINAFTLYLNGTVVNKSHTNMDSIDAFKYRFNPYNTRIPSKYIYVIPFCLSYDQTQPSGFYTFNGSAKNALIINRTQHVDLNCTVHVYAVVYDKLRFANSVISLRS
jgi:hypothetical protein